MILQVGCARCPEELLLSELPESSTDHSSVRGVVWEEQPGEVWKWLWFACKCKRCRLVDFGWWFQRCFMFIPYLGKLSNFTNIFQMGWNHQLVDFLFFFETCFGLAILMLVFLWRFLLQSVGDFVFNIDVSFATFHCCFLQMDGFSTTSMFWDYTRCCCLKRPQGGGEGSKKIKSDQNKIKSDQKKNRIGSKKK